MNNIILIGFMGSGKTTIGMRLAQKYQWTFLDTDQLVEKKENMKISSIFQKHGEAYFRDLETMCLKELDNGVENQIISVGGGLPLRKENRELIKRIGKVIYLQAKSETIYARLKNNTDRPLLQGDNPEEKIKTMLLDREKFYLEAANIIIDVDNQNYEEVANAIEEKLK